MKFSILGLLAATGYVGLVVASLKQLDSAWPFAVVLAWLAIVAYMFMLATDQLDRNKAVFGRMVLGCVATYFVLVFFLRPADPVNAPLNLLPHQWLTDARMTRFSPAPSPPQIGYVYPSPYGRSPYGAGYGPSQYGGYSSRQQSVAALLPSSEPSLTLEALASLNCALVFGLLAGGLGVWRCRSIDRQKTREKHLAKMNPLQTSQVSEEGNY